MRTPRQIQALANQLRFAAIARRFRDRCYYWAHLERRRAQARRSRKEARVRLACRQLNLPYQERTP